MLKLGKPSFEEAPPPGAPAGASWPENFEVSGGCSQSDPHGC